MRSAAEVEGLRAAEVALHEDLREASERAQKARVRFNAEERLRGQRILAAEAKAGRS